MSENELGNNINITKDPTLSPVTTEVCVETLPEDDQGIHATLSPVAFDWGDSVDDQKHMSSSIKDRKEEGVDPLDWDDSMDDDTPLSLLIRDRKGINSDEKNTYYDKEEMQQQEEMARSNLSDFETDATPILPVVRTKKVRRSQRVAAKSLGNFTNTADDPVIVDSIDCDKNGNVINLDGSSSSKKCNNKNDKRIGKGGVINLDDSSKVVKRKSNNERKGKIGKDKGKAAEATELDDIEEVKTTRNCKKRKRDEGGHGNTSRSSKGQTCLKDEMDEAETVTNKSKVNSWFGIRTRSSPFQLYKCITVLKRNQREAVRKMGFGRLLSFKMDGVPAKIAHYVVDKFNPEKMEIEVGSKRIKINVEAIHQLLGVPCEGKKIKTMSNLDKRDPQVNKWRKRYPGRFVAPTKIVEKIDDAQDEDTFSFRMDFLMLFLTVLVECHSQGRMKEKLLNYFTAETDFAKINWCDYIIAEMRKCKAKWERENVKSQFAGPLTILMLLYVDSIECKGVALDDKMNPITFWNMGRLKERQQWEIKHGGFGLGKKKKLSKVVEDDNERDGVLSLKDEIEEMEKSFEIIAKKKDYLEKKSIRSVGKASG